MKLQWKLRGNETLEANQSFVLSLDILGWNIPLFKITPNVDVVLRVQEGRLTDD